MLPSLVSDFPALATPTRASPHPCDPSAPPVTSHRPRSADVAPAGATPITPHARAFDEHHLHAVRHHDAHDAPRGEKYHAGTPRTCNRCSARFPSGMELHAHLRSCTPTTGRKRKASSSSASGSGPKAPALTSPGSHEAPASKSSGSHEAPASTSSGSHEAPASTHPHHPSSHRQHRQWTNPAAAARPRKARPAHVPTDRLASAATAASAVVESARAAVTAATAARRRPHHHTPTTPPTAPPAHPMPTAATAIPLHPAAAAIPPTIPFAVAVPIQPPPPPAPLQPQQPDPATANDYLAANTRVCDRCRLLFPKPANFSGRRFLCTPCRAQFADSISAFNQSTAPSRTAALAAASRQHAAQALVCAYGLERAAQYYSPNYQQPHPQPPPPAAPPPIPTPPPP